MVHLATLELAPQLRARGRRALGSGARGRRPCRCDREIEEELLVIDRDLVAIAMLVDPLRGPSVDRALRVVALKREDLADALHEQIGAWNLQRSSPYAGAGSESGATFSR